MDKFYLVGSGRRVGSTVFYNILRMCFNQKFGDVECGAAKFFTGREKSDVPLLLKAHHPKERLDNTFQKDIQYKEDYIEYADQVLTIKRPLLETLKSDLARYQSFPMMQFDTVGEWVKWQMECSSFWGEVSDYVFKYSEFSEGREDFIADVSNLVGVKIKIDNFLKKMDNLPKGGNPDPRRAAHPETLLSADHQSKQYEVNQEIVKKVKEKIGNPLV